MQAPLTDNIDVAQTAKEPAVLLLEARSLQCVKNDTVLFEDLDIALCGGEILQIDGANGSGKTSLIRILCGLAEADEGEVTWCGYNIQSYRSEYLQDLVYVAHANCIKTDLTLMENLVVSAGTLCENQRAESGGSIGPGGVIRTRGPARS